MASVSSAFRLIQAIASHISVWMHHAEKAVLAHPAPYTPTANSDVGDDEVCHAWLVHDTPDEYGALVQSALYWQVEGASNLAHINNVYGTPPDRKAPRCGLAEILDLLLLASCATMLTKLTNIAPLPPVCSDVGPAPQGPCGHILACSGRQYQPPAQTTSTTCYTLNLKPQSFNGCSTAKNFTSAQAISAKPQMGSNTPQNNGTMSQNTACSLRRPLHWLSGVQPTLFSKLLVADTSARGLGQMDHNHLEKEEPKAGK